MIRTNSERNFVFAPLSLFRRAVKIEAAPWFITVRNHRTLGHLLMYGIMPDIGVPVSVIVPVMSTSKVKMPTAS